MKKQKKITNSMQKVAVDILSELEVLMMKDGLPVEIAAIYKKMYDKYELCDDPFTGMCCTTEDFMRLSVERDKQTMINRYGHCDGLE